MQQPPVSLVNLSEEEKDKVAALAQRSLVRGSVMYLIPFFVFGFLVWYVNHHHVSLGLSDPNVRSFLNIGLVFLAILPARLFVNVVLRYRKSLNAWQKKVIRGKVVDKQGKVIFVSNQKIRLDEANAARVKTGDEVVVSLSTVNNAILDFEVKSS
jgi:hypothetical protein